MFNINAIHNIHLCAHVIFNYDLISKATKIQNNTKSYLNFFKVDSILSKCLLKLVETSELNSVMLSLFNILPFRDARLSRDPTSGNQLIQRRQQDRITPPNTLHASKTVHVTACSNSPCARPSQHHHSATSTNSSSNTLQIQNQAPRARHPTRRRSTAGRSKTAHGSRAPGSSHRS